MFHFISFIENLSNLLLVMQPYDIESVIKHIIPIKIEIVIGVV